MRIALCCLFLTLTSIFAESKPNIIFILVDDLGKQDLGCYGSTLYETPHIDAMANSGLKFENAYVAHPRCVPSRYAIFSGQYPARQLFQAKRIKSKNTLPLAKKTFAEHLKEAGYATGYIGKWHLGGHGGEPKYQGWDTSIMAGHAGAPPSYFYPFHKTKNGKSKEDFPPVDGKEGDYLTDRLTEEALQFIEQYKDKAFHLTLAHYAVHTPIEAPANLIEKYQKKLKDLKIMDGGKSSGKDAKKDTTGVYKTVQNNPAYAAMIEKLDNGIGKILKKVDELGISENTVIVLTSDHGGLSSRGLKSKRELATSNLPYRHGKGWIYEGGNRVPLLVKWPAKIKSSITKQRITGTDHYPTFLEMAGIPFSPQDHLDGKSYFSTFTGKSYDRGAIFWHSAIGRPAQTGDTNMSAVMEGDYKFIQCHNLKKVELYNISNDISEKNNLAQSMPEKALEMEKKLNTWKSSIGTEMAPTKNKKK
ncbi:MAG: sulfatase [Lentisphaeraceae bacterium]|nr:sulfatase [Lentisphaeraceae bacterium]